MKQLLLLSIILISNLTLSQIPIKKAGNFYELNDLWKRDSLSVKQLLNKYDLNISKLDTVRFFHQFDFNKQLHDNYSYTAYLYKINKNTGAILMDTFFYKGKKPMLNKYVMIVCFDAFSGVKTITIKVF